MEADARATNRPDFRASTRSDLILAAGIGTALIVDLPASSRSARLLEESSSAIVVITIVADDRARGAPPAPSAPQLRGNVPELAHTFRPAASYTTLNGRDLPAAFEARPGAKRFRRRLSGIEPPRAKDRLARTFIPCSAGSA
jgi:hypothetical protein